MIQLTIEVAAAPNCSYQDKLDFVIITEQCGCGVYTLLVRLSVNFLPWGPIYFGENITVNFLEYYGEFFNISYFYIR